MVTECLQPNCNPSSPSSSPSPLKEKKIKDTVHVSSFPLPEWLPKDTWETFLAHRRSVRATVTQKAYPSFVAKFEKLRAAGWEPGNVVDVMTEKGWRWFKVEWMENEKAGLFRQSGQPKKDPNDWSLEDL